MTCLHWADIFLSLVNLPQVTNCDRAPHDRGKMQVSHAWRDMVHDHGMCEVLYLITRWMSHNNKLFYSSTHFLYKDPVHKKPVLIFFKVKKLSTDSCSKCIRNCRANFLRKFTFSSKNDARIRNRKNTEYSKKAILIRNWVGLLIPELSFL